MSLRDALADRRESGLTRWHTRRTLQRESLAEHHGRVARATLLVCRALHYRNIAQPDTLAAVSMALVHDAAEVVTGDVPAPNKQRKGLADELIIEERDLISTSLFDNLPPEIAKQYQAESRRAIRRADLESQIVRYADKLEAYYFVESELALGNSTMNGDVQSSAREEIAKMRWDWLRALRAVEEGLP